MVSFIMHVRGRAYGLACLDDTMQPDVSLRLALSI